MTTNSNLSNEDKDYTHFTADDLRDELGKRGLKKAGRVAELRERLLNHDAKILEAEKDSEMLNNRPKCENCDDLESAYVKEAPAFYTCESENLALCNPCYDAHKRVKATRNHNVLPLTVSVRESRAIDIVLAFR